MKNRDARDRRDDRYDDRYGRDDRYQDEWEQYGDQYADEQNFDDQEKPDRWRQFHGAHRLAHSMSKKNVMGETSERA